MRDLNQFQSVNLWLTTVCGSPITAEKYTWVFGNFIDQTKINPDNIVKEWKEIQYKFPDNREFINKYTGLLQEYYSKMRENKHYAPATVENRIACVISFFKFFYIPLELRKQKHVYVKYASRDITKEEIKRILEHSNIREKAFYLMMIECGLRPRTIVQLKYKHIRRDFESGKIPMKIDVPAEIAKDRIGNRFTFIGQDGFNTLKEYFSLRSKLEDNDYLFVEKKDYPTKREYLSPETFSSFFCRTVLNLGLAKREEHGKPKLLRLYCLRKYFRNKIKDVDMAFREFWMGHKWGTDEHYLTRDVERHREEYAKGYPSLRIYEPETNEQIELLREEYDEKINELKEEHGKEITELREQLWHIVDHEIDAWARFEKILPKHLKKKMKKYAPPVFNLSPEEET